MVRNFMVQGFHTLCQAHTPLTGPSTHPTPHHPFPLRRFVLPFSRDILLKLTMTLTRLNGAKILRDPLVSQLLGEWLASSPLTKAQWVEATKAAQLHLIHHKQVEAVKQYASSLFMEPELIGLIMDLNVPKDGLWHVSEFMTYRGARLHHRHGFPFPRPIASRDHFTDISKQ